MVDSNKQAETASHYGISPGDHQSIRERLDRDPTSVELEIVAKTLGSVEARSLSRLVSRSASGLFNEKELVNIGEGRDLILRASTFGCASPDEAESRAVQCISTAVGEVASSGAQPLLIVHSRFISSWKNRGMKKLVRGLASGARHYGVQMGIPVRTAELTSEPGYEGYPIFLAAVIGLIRRGRRVFPAASGVGNPVFLLGPRSQGKDPSLDVERARVEICQDLSQRSYLVGMESVGPEGLAVAGARMAVNGESGLTLNLAGLVGREKGMSAQNMLFSYTLGRVLVVIAEGFEKELRGICRKSGIPCSLIGRVGEKEMFTIRMGQTEFASLPLGVFTDTKERSPHEPWPVKPAYFDNTARLDVTRFSKPKSYSDTLSELLRTPNVLVNTLMTAFIDREEIGVDDPESGSRGRIILEIRSAGRFAHLDPLSGGRSAVMAAVRGTVCRGAVPKGALSGLLVGKGRVQSDPAAVREVLRGLQEGFGGVDIPAVGLFLETEHEHPYPTPVVGVIGFLDGHHEVVTPQFKDPDDFVLLLGSHRGELGGSEYLSQIHGRLDGPPPVSEVNIEHRIHDIILMSARVGLVKSAIPVSRGGLAVALMQSLVGAARGTGARIHMSSKLRSDEMLFGETQGLVLITIDEDSLIEIERLCMRLGVPCTAIGRVTDDGHLSFDGLIRLEVEKVRKLLTRSLKDLVWG